MRLTTLLGVLSLCSFSSAYTKLSDDSLKSIPEPGKDFDIKTGSLLAPILTVRIPGTPGAEAVRQHFLHFFRTQLPDWRIELQNSTQPTALGGDPVTFVNVIASRDPPWSRPGHVGRLALVAHYDSKLTPTGFIGATDSAAPCAMMLHAARALDAAMTRKWAAMEAAGQTNSLESEKGIQLILLDGEEAFVSWSEDDSVYGARALAADWDQMMNPAMSTYHSRLNEISLFVLLDLLGSKNPRMPSYFKTTHWAYKNMAAIETRLRTLKLFKSSPNHASKTQKLKADGPVRQSKEPIWLQEADKQDTAYWMGGMIEDDHLPFMKRGVEVFHLIPSPFPDVWHTAQDDGEHLDMDTTEDWAKLTTAFVAEWMDLEGYMTAGKPALDRRNDEQGETREKSEL
ncbi:40S ribosomal protein [Venturia nashicola]|uniref:Peptide hydrolase n=1 Tax=Venturia nashicola TaxID=86259 RepID=A0A4Z1NDH4_9PEZI|nr:40S ribosomal protein [Venturia nashicola]